MKQFENSKKDYIHKIKRELETVEERFQKIVNQTEMEGEDFRSTARRNIQKFFVVTLEMAEQVKLFEDMKLLKE